MSGTKNSRQLWIEMGFSFQFGVDPKISEGTSVAFAVLSVIKFF